MVLKLKKIDISVLLFHISLMRKSAKKVFKRNYSKEEGKEILKSYDGLKGSLESKLQEIEEQPEEKIYELKQNKFDIDVLQSFLDAYIPKLENELKTAGNIQKEDAKQVECLKGILNQCNKLLEGAKTA